MEVLWSGGAIILAAVIIGWGAESAQMYIGQGLALAVVAWLQTSPEFAVEATLAWHQKQDLLLASLTGSLRLLLGLGWPLVFFTTAAFRKPREHGARWASIRLPWFNGLEVFILLIASIYFTFVWLKGSLTLGDSLFLLIFYVVYLFQIVRQNVGEKEEPRDLPAISLRISRMGSPAGRWSAILILFIAGAALLYFATEPFLTGLEALAASFGISAFFFIQWIAPFASEFPEKVTAFQWARRVQKAPMALANMMSSNAVQWTLLAALLPVIFSVARRAPTPIFFNGRQEAEIILTVAQSFLAVVLLMDLEFGLRDATVMLVLWAVQFFIPSWRTLITILYFVWMLFELGLLIKNRKFGFALKEYKKNRAHH